MTTGGVGKRCARGTGRARAVARGLGRAADVPPFARPPGSVVCFAAADRVSTDRAGVQWLREMRYSIWVVGVGFLDLHDPLAGVLLRLGLWVRQQWGRQLNWWH